MLCTLHAQIERETNYKFMVGYLASFAGDLPTKYEVEDPKVDDNITNQIYHESSHGTLEDIEDYPIVLYVMPIQNVGTSWNRKHVTGVIGETQPALLVEQPFQKEGPTRGHFYPKNAQCLFSIL